MREQGAGFLSVSLPFSSPSSLPASAPPGRGSLMPLPPEGYGLAPGSLLAKTQGSVFRRHL